MTYKYLDTTWKGHSIRLVVVDTIRPFQQLQALYDFGVSLQDGNPDNIVAVEAIKEDMRFYTPGHQSIGEAFLDAVDLNQFRGQWREAHI
ncbi:hypothetical protein [Hymenobacter sp. IS2118]|uniref:hypothetical protein n=1 Tax=Hymenobacter sp. IS2118 TaxID=1505605 RepID=UPI001268CD1F|nr:hypothetical protein [Hymenobacter sp. IS2118]